MVKTKGENLRDRTRPRLISPQIEPNKPGRRHTGHIMLLEACSPSVDLSGVTIVLQHA